MNRIRTLLAALMTLVLVAGLGGGAPTVTGSPVATTPTSFAVAPAVVERRSRPTLSHQEEDPPAIIGVIDSGGTLKYTLTATSGLKEQGELKVRMGEDQGGTPARVAYQANVTFRSDEEGSGAPVATVVVTKVEIDKAQPQVFEGTSPVDPDGAAVLPGTMEFPLQSEETYTETMGGAASGTFAS